MIGVLAFDSPEGYKSFVECNQNIEVISLEVYPKQFISVLVLTYKSSGIKLVNEIAKDNMRLREALESVQSQLFSIRGIDKVHDSEITGICAEIRKTLEGGEIK